MATVNERLSEEAIAHTLFVSRYSTGVAKKMIKILNQSDAELSAKLFAALDELEPDSFTVKRLESLLGDVRKVNEIATQSMLAGLQTEIKDFAKHEAGYQLDLFSSLLPAEVLERFPLAGISFEQVYAAAMSKPFQGRLLKDWASNLESDRLKRITTAVSNGFLQGETVETIIRRVRGTKGADYKDGALQVSRANAASIIKTAVNHTAAEAREKFAKNNSDIIKAKQWSSTLDTKTSAQCRIRDRLMYSLKNKPLGHKIPYLQGPGKIHFCCRSSEKFVTKSWRELGFKKGELSGATRATMDGQIPAETSYLEWLSKQSAYRQDQVLGAERGRMYRAGEIKLSDMYTDNGEWLTLAQLKEIETAGRKSGFSLADAKTLRDIENGMQGVIANQLHFPDGTPIESAKEAAQAMSDVLTKFNLAPLSSFSEREGMKASAAGAYFKENQSIHISAWALEQQRWDEIRKNGSDVDFLSMLPIKQLDMVNVAAEKAAKGFAFEYAAKQSVAGTVTHEMGHHLYYSNLDELEYLSTKAYQAGWWRPVSYYAASNERELFAEAVALYMLGDESEHKRINPELLEWLKKNSRT
ncbi:hypothetical protein M993_04773 [Obesumbacterium proteus ATCC 12841]|uniref:Phage head morphogenesis domain-containing protein n=1 Tax=Obesumbacterium proteus ATCC 12841 TaxID=1354268 RepID=A0AA91EE37_9GAMM|nr:hypothetical protein M993_04773 [Obesumbacterium proteus ATCC 12841]